MRRLRYDVVVAPIMYPLYKEVLSERVISVIQNYYTEKVKIIQCSNVSPYILVGDLKIGIESQLSNRIRDCIVQMFKLFNIYELWDDSCVSDDGILFKGTKNNLNIVESRSKHNWMGKINNWYVFSLNDLPMYEVNDGKLDRLFLLLIVDPLAFIFRMRHIIDRSSLGVQQVFGIMEDSINDMMLRYVIKYFLASQLGCKGLVNDVVLIIIRSWIQFEIWSLVKS